MNVIPLCFAMLCLASVVVSYDRLSEAMPYERLMMHPWRMRECVGEQPMLHKVNGMKTQSGCE